MVWSLKAVYLVIEPGVLRIAFGTGRRACLRVFLRCLCRRRALAEVACADAIRSWICGPFHDVFGRAPIQPDDTACVWGVNESAEIEA